MHGEQKVLVFLQNLTTEFQGDLRAGFRLSLACAKARSAASFSEPVSKVNAGLECTRKADCDTISCVGQRLN